MAHSRNPTPRNPGRTTLNQVGKFVLISPLPGGHSDRGHDSSPTPNHAEVVLVCEMGWVATATGHHARLWVGAAADPLVDGVLAGRRSRGPGLCLGFIGIAFP